MIKYVRVMDGVKSNANGFEYKVDEVLEVFVNYAGEENLAYESTKIIYNMLKDIQDSK